MPSLNPRVGGTFEFLRSELDLSGVVGRYTELKDSYGALAGFCPLQEQRSGNPGFRVYPDGFAHCFSCGFHGDVTKFWQTKHEIETPYEAAKDLAREFNIELPDEDPAARERYRKRREKEEAHQNTAKTLHVRPRNDLESGNGHSGNTTTGPEADVLAYLEDRGFGEESQKRFLLGATPDGHASIPFWSGGSIHGVIKRKIDDSKPKYLFPNKEDLPLGRKPLMMVEAPRAAEYILTEGVLDVLALALMGYKAIGFGGGQASKEQFDDLLDMGRKGATFAILPDDEERGKDNGLRMSQKLYPYARLCAPIPVEGVKDAADLLQLYGSGEESTNILRSLVEDATDALEIALGSMPTGARDKVRHLKDKVVPLILKIEERSERGAIVKEVSKLDGLNAEIVRDAITEVEGKLLVQAPDQRPDEEEIPKEEWAPLLDAGVLDRYVSDVCKIKGVVGEQDKKAIKLLFSNALEAQLDPLPTGRPIGGAIMLTGESGRGKNYLSDAAVRALPEEWYLSFEAASATSFYYAAEIDPAFLKHKFIYPNEAEAVDTVVEFLRPMFSQAKAKKYVTNKNSDGSHVFQEIEVEGPITGVVPTTRNTLNKELQTRMLVCELENYENQIKDHTAALSRQFSPDFVADPHGHVVPKWRAALRSLTEVRKVVIPFGDHEEFRLSNEDIRHGARIWGNLLGLMCAHAWLEQNNRDTREIRGRESGAEAKAVVATAEDYKVAYELIKSVGVRSVINLSETHRKIVQAVYDLKEEESDQFASDGFSGRAIARKAGISPGTVTKNRTFLIKSVGLLYDTDEGKISITDDAEPSWWEGGDAMKGFPLPSIVQEWEDTHALSTGNSGNTETLSPTSDTYAEKPVSNVGNTRETLETPLPNGPERPFVEETPPPDKEGFV